MGFFYLNICGAPVSLIGRMQHVTCIHKALVLRILIIIYCVDCQSSFTELTFESI